MHRPRPGRLWSGEDMINSLRRDVESTIVIHRRCVATGEGRVHGCERPARRGGDVHMIVEPERGKVAACIGPGREPRVVLAGAQGDTAVPLVRPLGCWCDAM